MDARQTVMRVTWFQLGPDGLVVGWLSGALVCVGVSALSLFVGVLALTPPYLPAWVMWLCVTGCTVGALVSAVLIPRIWRAGWLLRIWWEWE